MMVRTDGNPDAIASIALVTGKLSSLWVTILCVRLLVKMASTLEGQKKAAGFAI